MKGCLLAHPCLRPYIRFTNTCHANEGLSIPAARLVLETEYKGSGKKAWRRCWQIKNSLPEVPLSISQPSNIYLQFFFNKPGVNKCPPVCHSEVKQNSDVSLFSFILTV